MSTLIITRPPQFLDPWFIEIEQVWDEIEAANNDLETRLAAAELILASSLVTSVNKFGGPTLAGAITLSQGTNITLTQAGQNIEIAATVTPPASAVSFTPSGGISSTNVQDALEELDTEKAAVGHTHVAADVTDFDEAAQDATAVLFDSATHDGVSTSYNDASAELTITNTDKGSVAIFTHLSSLDPHPEYTLKDLNFTTVSTTHLTSNETAILADSSGGAFTITVSTADISNTSYKVLIKDTGNASTNNITIDTEGTETIDGQASITLSVDYSWVWLQSDGTNLHVIG